MGDDVSLTLRISHPAFSGAKNAETVRFYTEVLGMELPLRQDNLDYPSEEHLFFAAGNDNFIAYFVQKDEAAIVEPARSGSGWMDHLALDVDSAGLAEGMHRLERAGIPYEGPVDRGYQRSIDFKNPNGVTIELLCWLTPPPVGISQAAIIHRAQTHREARGAALAALSASDS